MASSVDASQRTSHYLDVEIGALAVFDLSNNGLDVPETVALGHLDLLVIDQHRMLDEVGVFDGPSLDVLAFQRPHQVKQIAIGLGILDRLQFRLMARQLRGP